MNGSKQQNEWDAPASIPGLNGSPGLEAFFQVDQFFRMFEEILSRRPKPQLPEKI